MGRGTLGEVRDGLGYAPGGPGWVGGPSVMSGTGRRTHRVARDGLGVSSRNGERDNAPHR